MTSDKAIKRVHYATIEKRGAGYAAFRLDGYGKAQWYDTLPAFGRFMACDLGKRLYWVTYDSGARVLQMESDAQRDAREAMTARQLATLGTGEPLRSYVARGMTPDGERALREEADYRERLNHAERLIS